MLERPLRYGRARRPGDFRPAESRLAHGSSSRSSILTVSPTHALPASRTASFQGWAAPPVRARGGEGNGPATQRGRDGAAAAKPARWNLPTATVRDPRDLNRLSDDAPAFYALNRPCHRRPGHRRPCRWDWARIPLCATILAGAFVVHREPVLEGRRRALIAGQLGARSRT